MKVKADFMARNFYIFSIKILYFFIFKLLHNFSLIFYPFQLILSLKIVKAWLQTRSNLV